MKKIVITCILFLSLFPLTANDSLIQALQNDDFQKVEEVFLSAPESEQDELADVILARAEELVKENRFEDALELAGIVLKGNIENPKAQEIYSSTRAAIARRQKKEAETSNAPIESTGIVSTGIENIESEKERIKVGKELEKLEDQKKRKIKRQKRLAELKEEYSSELGDYKMAFFGSITPFAIDISHSKIIDIYSGTRKVNARGGFGFKLQGDIGNPYIKASLNIDPEFYVIRSPKKDLKILFPLRLAFTSPFYTGPFSIGLGFRYHRLKPGTSALVYSLPTFVIGLGIDQWYILDNLDLSAYIDWNAASAWIKEIQFGMIIATRLRYHFPDFYKKLGWYVQNDLSVDTLFIKGRAETSFMISFSIGISYDE